MQNSMNSGKTKNCEQEVLNESLRTRLDRTRTANLWLQCCLRPALAVLHSNYSTANDANTIRATPLCLILGIEEQTGRITLIP